MTGVPAATTAKEQRGGLNLRLAGFARAQARLVLPAGAQANVRRVPSEYSTIQHAVDATRPWSPPATPRRRSVWPASLPGYCMTPPSSWRLIVWAVVSLVGRWNGWLPSWQARLLRVDPSLPARALPTGAS